MKMYTIICGVNGVGKTSFVGVLKSCMTDLGVIVDVNKITFQLGGNVLEGVKRVTHIIEKCVNDGVNFTQETTFSGNQPKVAVKQAKDKGYYIRLYYIGIDTIEESKRRIANRWKALGNVLLFCDEAVFYDNDNGFVEVAMYRNGDLILRGDYHPNWIMELSKYLKEKQ